MSSEYVIIPNEDPIERDGVLGTDLFRINNDKINYEEGQLEFYNKQYPFLKSNWKSSKKSLWRKNIPYNNKITMTCRK